MKYSLPPSTSYLLASALLFGASCLSAQAGRSGSRSYETQRGGTVEAQGQSYGRFKSGSVSAESANGSTYDAQGVRAGRFSAGSASATGANGGTYDAQGVRVGRASAGSVNATGANGATYDAQGAHVGRYGQGTVNATGVNGGTYTATKTTYNGYRSGYVYTGGVYRPATVTVNALYVAPIGAYAGWSVMTQPYYVSYPVYATYPVETAVQVELKKRGFYAGPIDGQIGPGTQQSIANYQQANGLKVNGKINKALLVSLGIVPA